MLGPKIRGDVHCSKAWYLQSGPTQQQVPHGLGSSSAAGELGGAVVMVVVVVLPVLLVNVGAFAGVCRVCGSSSLALRTGTKTLWGRVNLSTQHLLLQFETEFRVWTPLLGPISGYLRNGADGVRCVHEP